MTPTPTAADLARELPAVGDLWRRFVHRIRTVAPGEDQRAAEVWVLVHIQSVSWGTAGPPCVIVREGPWHSEAPTSTLILSHDATRSMEYLGRFDTVPADWKTRPVGTISVEDWLARRAERDAAEKPGSTPMAPLAVPKIPPAALYQHRWRWERGLPDEVLRVLTQQIPDVTMLTPIPLSVWWALPSVTVEHKLAMLLRPTLWDKATEHRAEATIRMFLSECEARYPKGFHYYTPIVLLTARSNPSQVERDLAVQACAGHFVELAGIVADADAGASAPHTPAHRAKRIAAMQREIRAQNATLHRVMLGGS